MAEKKQQIEEEKRVQQIFDDQLVKNAQIAAALDQKVKEVRTFYVITILRFV